MRHLKRLIFIVFLMVLGLNKIYATTCYYANNDNRVLFSYDTTSELFTVEKRDYKKNLGTEPLLNNNKQVTETKTNTTVAAIDGSKCPTYIVYRHKAGLFGSDKVYGFDSLDKASELTTATNETNSTRLDAWTLSITNVSQQEFIKMKENNILYATQDTSCDGIFGDKDDPESLRYLLNEILIYPKIIVPILVIILGTLDLAKAVVASKEDEMKKAQKTFIKRIMIGIIIFFVPTIMNVIMYLADIVWNGAFTTCGL